MLANRIMSSAGKKVYDSFTKSLLHFDIAGNLLKDEIGRIWTQGGSLGQGTGKFGVGSLFDGAGGWIDTPDSVDFTLGSTDFTFDFWMKRNGNLGTTNCLFGQTDNVNSTPSTSIFVNLDGSDKIATTLVNNANVGYTLQSTITISDLTTWHHIAIVRSGGTLYTFTDGVSGGFNSIGGITVKDSPNKFAIGRGGEWPGSYFNGYIDEFRFSKGIARWTADFTPPTKEY
jgi:hypothetical protein